MVRDMGLRIFMDGDALFDALDLDGDGRLSREELREVAPSLGWHWPEAPLYAVLDLMTVRESLSKARFDACLDAIVNDAYGPYGKVLLDAPSKLAATDPPDTVGRSLGVEAAPSAAAANAAATLAVLEETGDATRVEDYGKVLERLDPPRWELGASEGALLVLDPQRSFTRGVWMRSIGPGGEGDVAPIRLAFAHCARRIETLGDRVERMFTRCPFPPDSYGWDERVGNVIGAEQLYFIKPGNSALWPPTNGFSPWLESLLARGKDTLVIGGCTLNSCVRVTAVETAVRFAERGLRVVVDLSLAGGRAGNYEPSALFHGRSPVGAAVEEMVTAGALVVTRVDWR